MFDFFLALGISFAFSSSPHSRLYDFKLAALLIYLQFCIICQILMLLQENSDFLSSEFLLSILKELLHSRKHTFVLLGICWIEVKIRRCNQPSSILDFGTFAKFTFIYSIITSFEFDHLSRIIFIIQLAILAYFIEETEYSGFKVDVFILCLFESWFLYFLYDSGFNNFMISANYYFFYPFINVYLLIVFQVSSFDRNNHLSYQDSISNTLHQMFDANQVSKKTLVNKEIFNILLNSFLSIFLYFIAFKCIYGLSSYIKMNIIFLIAYPLAGCMCNYKKYDNHDTYLKNVYAMIFSLFLYSWLFGFLSFFN
jgi:hypothetical protein